MCTVTIIPTNDDDFVLTSNRDEAPTRKSLAPDFYTVDGTKLLFPKDELAGGTWIGVSEKNRLVCVLNGGFELHERKETYRKSRGVIAKDFMVAEHIVKTIEHYVLVDIEPFTIVIADWNNTLKFYELVWDGAEKHFVELPLEPKIWSSSTLYTEAMKQERLQWFENFKKGNELSAKSLMNFHKTAGVNNKDYGVIMDRGFVKTTSITQVEKTGDTIEMRHQSLQNKSNSSTVFNLPQTVNE
ncbi:NRDE family protein [Flavobacteriaceae bacterium SZ-1-7]|uniref:NRDE family protein n=1 Tax=Tamlana sedimenti TaxID=3134126 RepID=UPI0031208C3F